MKPFLFFLILLTAAGACQHPDKPSNTPSAGEKDSTTAAQRFFPVPDFIGGQLKMIDSLQLPLTKSVTVNNKTTLGPISDEALRALAKNFQQPDINDTALKKWYRQSNIADQSIPSVTLIYTALRPELPLREINVFVKPDAAGNDKVSAVYLSKSFVKNDTIIDQKLYWKTDRNFQITTEKQIHGKVLPAEQLKVTWDPTN